MKNSAPCFANTKHPTQTSVLLLSRELIAKLVTPSDYLTAVERGFCAHKAGMVVLPSPMHLPAQGGGFHAKGALLRAQRNYVALSRVED